MLSKINNVIEKVFAVISVVLLAIFIVVVFVKVIARNYMKVSMVWADEIALLFFLWTVFLGAAIALRHKQHFIVDLSPAKIKLNLTLDIISHFIVMTLIYVMIYHGYKFTMSGLSRASNSLPFSLAYFFAPIPIAGGAMFLFTIELIIKDVKQIFSLNAKGVT